MILNSIDEKEEELTHPIQIANGYATPPEGPGWGTDIDDEVLKKYPPSELVPVESEPYLDFFKVRTRRQFETIVHAIPRIPSRLSRQLRLSRRKWL